MKQFAIVGCGEISKQHADNILRLGKLAAVCDVAVQKAQALAQSCEAKAYASVDDLLQTEKEVDLVVVCTPNGLHAEHIIKSLQAGKDVLTESPLCLTKAAAWQIIETEKYCGRKLFVAQTMCYQKQVVQLTHLLSNDAQSKNIYPPLSGIKQATVHAFNNWRGTSFPGGGLLYSSFSNCIDAMLLLFGEITTVSRSSNHEAHAGSEVEAAGAVLLRFANNVTGLFEWSVDSTAGNKASFSPDGKNEGSLLKIDDNNDNELYSLLYDDLMIAFAGGKTSVPDVFDGAKTVEAIEKIYKAVR